MRYFTGFFIILSSLYAQHTNAQLIDFLSVGTDSTCIHDRSDRLLVRVFTMQKFNKYTLGQHDISDNVTYKANNNYHIGLGFHYKWIGANATFQLPYFNGDGYGRTRFFDLQSYLFLGKIAIDLYVLSYKGYYLADNDILTVKPVSPPRLIREDLKTGNYGANFQYIFNHKRFSYRASFVQSQCQLQSAGSAIVGGGIHYTRARADSAIIPTNVEPNAFYYGHLFNRSSVFSVAINGGYAYTYVFKQSFFITAAAIIGTGLNYCALKTDATDERDVKLQPQVHGIVRAAAGYNTDKYFVGLQYINYISRNNMPPLDSWQQLQTGNIRLTIAKRFKLKKKTVQTLDDIEDAIIPEF